jgi:hypothetical protein
LRGATLRVGPEVVREIRELFVVYFSTRVIGFPLNLIFGTNLQFKHDIQTFNYEKKNMNNTTLLLPPRHNPVMFCVGETTVAWQRKHGQLVSREKIWERSK